MQNVFVDTNILVYYFSKDNIKRSSAQKLLADSNYRVFTSTQVLSEFLSVISKKYTDDIELIKSFFATIRSSFEVIGFDEKDLEEALNIQKKYRLAYYDSLIITNALKANCTILYSEDMHHSLKIEKQLTIINQFK